MPVNPWPRRKTQPMGVSKKQKGSCPEAVERANAIFPEGVPAAAPSQGQLEKFGVLVGFVEAPPFSAT
jgi:hypothetical protein